MVYRPEWYQKQIDPQIPIPYWYQSIKFLIVYIRVGSKKRQYQSNTGYFHSNLQRQDVEYKTNISLPMLDQYIHESMLSIININNGTKEPTCGYQNYNTTLMLVFEKYVKVRASL